MGIDWIEYGLAGLFVGAFLSATIIPLPLEALLIGMLALGFAPISVLIVATTGNFLGGLTNYWIGYKANNDQLLRRFNINQTKIKKWETRSKRWGYWLGLLSWLPFIGDPMVIVLGFLKIQFWPLCLTMFVGKFLRYLVLVLLYLKIW